MLSGRQLTARDMRLSASGRKLSAIGTDRPQPVIPLCRSNFCEADGRRAHSWMRPWSAAARG